MFGEILLSDKSACNLSKRIERSVGEEPLMENRGQHQAIPVHQLDNLLVPLTPAHTLASLKKGERQILLCQKHRKLSDALTAVFADVIDG